MGSAAGWWSDAETLTYVALGSSTSCIRFMLEAYVHGACNEIHEQNLEAAARLNVTVPTDTIDIDT